MKIRERLKEMEFRKTELSDYLRISRPTLDKFILEYDSGNRESVKPRVRKFFDYIGDDSHPVGKKSAVKFLLTNLADDDSGDGEKVEEETEEFLQVKHYLLENPDAAKSKFIALLVQKTDFDDIAEYLLKIQPLLRERRLTEEQIALLKPYDDIRAIMENHTEE